MAHRIIFVAVVAAAAGLTGLAPATAQVSPVANGARCSFAAVIDPIGEASNDWIGQVTGGPLTAATPGAAISLTCTLQVGAANSTHAGVDSCSAGSPATLQSSGVAPTLCSYQAAEGQPVYLCAGVHIDGTMYYWDATVTNPGALVEEAAGWTIFDSATCEEAVSQELYPGPAGPVGDVVCVQSEHPPYWDVYTCRAVVPNGVQAVPPPG